MCAELLVWKMVVLFMKCKLGFALFLAQIQKYYQEVCDIKYLSNNFNGYLLGALSFLCLDWVQEGKQRGKWNEYRLSWCGFLSVGNT